MQVKDLKSQIEKLKSEGTLNNQTIEFVVDTKKFFAHDIKAGTDTMTFQISRKNYRPLTAERFSESLNQANSTLETKIFNTDTNKEMKIQELFCSPVYLEISVE